MLFSRITKCFFNVAYFGVFLVLICLSSSARASIANPFEDTIEAGIRTTQEVPVASMYSFPQGMVIRVYLLTKISSQTAYKGQLVEARIAQPIYSGEKMVLSPNDKLIGEIDESLQPRIGQNGLIGLRFTTLIRDNIFKYPIRATTITYQDHSYFGGQGTDGTQPERVLYRIKGVPDYDGFVLRGIREMGSNLVFNPGDQITLKLDAPLKVFLSD